MTDQSPTANSVRDDIDNPAGRDGELMIDGRTQVFLEHRGRLFAVAYRMLGNVLDADDVLQEVWGHWVRVTREVVHNPVGYLVRATVNESLDRLTSIRRRREVAAPTWLPEPQVEQFYATGVAVGTTPPADGADDPASAAMLADSLSIAMLVVLQTLSPLERTVYVLREAFGYEHTEIAGRLGRSTVAVRQLSHRARRHVRRRERRYEVSDQEHQALTQRFLGAAQGGDVGALIDVLAADVDTGTDSGSTATYAARPIVRGQDKLIRLLGEVTTKGRMPEPTVRACRVDGILGAALRAEGCRAVSWSPNRPATAVDR